MIQENSIRFSFDGGMAAKNQMSFYEAARFQYAAARLILKLEHFRKTQRVLDKVSEKIEADIRVSAAKKGSWELEVLIVLLPAVTECLVKVPLEILFAYLINFLKPKSKGKLLAEELIKIEEERTKQSQEETKRMQIMRDALKDQMTASLALMKIQEHDLTSLKKVRPDLIENQTDLDFIAKELQAEIDYENMIEPYKPELEKISPEQETELASMFRKSSKEMALPLRNSAKSLAIGIDKAPKPICIFNKESLENIAVEIEDDLPTILNGTIKAYDKETGWGKFRNAGQFSKPIPFMVPARIKKENLHDISQAFLRNEIYARFYFVRNPMGIPIRLVFDGIVSDEEMGI